MDRTLEIYKELYELQKQLLKATIEKAKYRYKMGRLSVYIQHMQCPPRPEHAKRMLPHQLARKTGYHELHRQFVDKCKLIQAKITVLEIELNKL